MSYIPQHALANLRNYSYKGVDKSLLSNYVLNPYWTWLVTLWPTWVAPNMITLSGLSIVIINFLTLLYYDPTYLAQKGGASVPQWVYYTWGAGLFLYQSFDAIDGKQARRTGMAGPLGEMFDHGCDALNTTLEVILASHALNLGRSWWTVAAQVATLANFYLTTWEEYYTGQLYLGVFSGPVEGIIMIVAIYILTGIYGPTFWDNKILTFTGLDQVDAIASRVPNIALNELFMVFGTLGMAFNIATSYVNVFRSRRASHGSVFKPLWYLLPFPLSVAAQVLWMNHPKFTNSDILRSPAFVPFLCAWGLQFAHQVGRMILAHVTGQPFPWWDSMWVWSVIGAVDANLPWLIGRPPIIQSSPENTEKFVYVTLAIAFLSYSRFVVLVINDITNYLGIACLTVRKKDARGVWRQAGPQASSEKKV
ncbi:phosphatidylinositol synthase 1 (CDP-alcohol phosphatidyltransferase1) [Heterobasidion irregulare TC 32-1]|uniref:diacylglycerol cholinephosphotransferase n=1 Tax=Heterobasidion irregulare (strain TC 32-1) TaxID=747525 RepID=W4KMQ1_HETIT|nr:phosphatidylinositol synthase 1 (CDP-alcohol phosphatidyltransferase1) [Heterobasidion irregulare TC 32-1]ETW86660.1 phosphatidylinositol synthase 1 (CDP-alcohol phosphatidyltransferase1) [Heterobasidion irregulare TC 32-1]